MTNAANSNNTLKTLAALVTALRDANSNTTDAKAGARYDADGATNVADVAKAVRKAMRTNLPKGSKFSVRISRYSMGQSIDVRIKSLPGIDLTSLVTWVAEPGHVNNVGGENGWWRAEHVVLDYVKALLASYNRSDIDSQTDYYNVWFHSSVELSSDLRIEAGEAADAKAARVGNDFAAWERAQAIEDAVQATDEPEVASAQVAMLTALGVL